MNNKNMKITEQIKIAMRRIQTKQTAANLAAYVRSHKAIAEISKRHMEMMGGGR